MGSTAQTVFDTSSLTASSSGTTPIVLHDDPRAIMLCAEVTKNGGTSPTLDVTWQHSRDGVTWWDLASTSQFTDSGKEAIHVTNASTVILPMLRVKPTLGGTDPDFAINAYVVF